ncbi:MAG: phage major capsid protein [Taibaiella sp.]|nr:phage major capsid protein [Taibaiella sp.]
MKEAVSVIEKKINASQEKTNEAVEFVKKELVEAEKRADEKVKVLTEEMAKKDATFLDISEQVKELKAKNGRFKEQEEKTMSLKDAVSKALEGAKDELYKMGGQQSGEIAPIAMKNISSSSLSANILTYLPDRAGLEPLGQTRFRDQVRVIHSDTDFVQYPRANTPIGTGSFGRVTESATKPVVDRGYTMVPLTLKVMAGIAIASRQSLRNITWLREWLPISMLEQLLDTEDLDFANQLIAAIPTATTTATVSAEKLIEYIRVLIQSKFYPTGIMIDPAVWSEILRTKPNDYSVPFVISIDGTGGTRILGRQLTPVNWLTGRRVIVGDWTKAAIVQSEGLVIRQSDSHASTFQTNETTFLLERTEGLAIFRPDAFVTAIM